MTRWATTRAERGGSRPSLSTIHENRHSFRVHPWPVSPVSFEHGNFLRAKLYCDRGMITRIRHDCIRDFNKKKLNANWKPMHVKASRSIPLHMDLLLRRDRQIAERC